MESAIKTFVEAFLRSAKFKDNIPEKQFQKLMDDNLKNIMSETDVTSATALAEIRKGVEEKQDGKVNFNEYMSVLGYLATKLSEKQLESKEAAPTKTEEE
ncbi:hypothetical protein SKAU_G00223750 [Synaphobranchus kaupii]|uniref:Uncharacterized protein n=1 Tax=Synaphobranchus kaupii TaxID=118154 RepID=A0A9Q1FBU3_SYNKA|nr:hypothetical protein SKAU_G00223750 [Synaphobranchus kaupii]